MDEAVVRRAQRGDHGAFAEIVDETIDRLYAVASLLARDRALAEDAVQEALIRAWRDLPSLRQPDRISAWLTRLTVNATYDLLRRQRRVREFRPLTEVSASLADVAPASIDRIALGAAFGQLPPEQRAVLILHYFSGLSLDDAAAHLGIPRGTVRSRLNAALSTLRRRITPRGESQPGSAGSGVMT